MAQPQMSKKWMDLIPIVTQGSTVNLPHYLTVTCRIEPLWQLGASVVLKVQSMG